MTLKKLILFAFSALFTLNFFAQDWTLKLSSNVELRTWKLTTKADKEEKGLSASIKLFKGTTLVTQMSSDANGDFTVLVPSNGEFVLEVSYAGCNTKKFFISTLGVPEEVAKDNFDPTFSIGGFVMAKPFPGIDYSGLQKTLVKVQYFSKGRKFDNDDVVTNGGMDIVSKIASNENILIEKFCSTNRAGDAALAKPDCPLAKRLYGEAIALIPGEEYPVVQLAKVGLCLKEMEEAAKKAGEKAAADKVAADKAAADKAEADKLAKEKAGNKAEADKAAKEKAEADKLARAESEKANKEKTANAKTEKEKALAEKLAAQKAARAEKEKANDGKVITAKASKPVDPDDIEANNKRKAKEKEAKEIAKKQKEGMARSKEEDLAAEKADYEKSEAKRKKREADEAEKKKFAYETKHKDGEGQMDKGNSDHRIPQVIGGNKYKEYILKADDYFKTKRYKEAKVQYEEALKIKPNDVHAMNRLALIEKVLTTK